MPAAYLLADFAILPTTHPESFGRAAVEPQVMGRPVIAADHGGVTETIVNGATGWLAPVGDAAAWATALARAIDLGPGKRLEMGEAGRTRARRLYSVDAMCAATLCAYEKVLEARA
jgi:glycosyltransferase involved in cell wall biosynthesis